MQKVVRNLFDMRRAQFPQNEFVLKKCTNPGKNLDVLPRQECFHSYCQTLILTDHERGLIFSFQIYKNFLFLSGFKLLFKQKVVFFLNATKIFKKIIEFNNN